MPKNGRNDRGLKCVCLNACSVANKRHLLECVIGEDKIDIVFITESHLSDNIPSHEIFGPNFSVFRRDRNREGGGVLIAAKNSLPISRRIDLENECELLWCEVIHPGAYLILLGVFYRKPNFTLDDLEFLSDSLHCIRRKHKNAKIVLTGDFNVPEIDWYEYTYKNGTARAKRLLDMVSDFFLTQHVMDITRYISNSVLDLVFSSDPYHVRDLQVKPGISDHERVVFTLSTSMKIVNQSKHRIYDYKNTDMDLLYNSLSSVLWPNVKDALCINTAWEQWKQVFFAVVDDIVPSRYVSSSKHKLPWINSYHKRLIRKQNRLHRKVKQNNTEFVKKKYITHRKMVKIELRKAELGYINNMCDNVDRNPKQFWNYLKVKRSNNIGIGSLRDGDHIYNSDLDKAELLSDQFKSVFNHDMSLNSSFKQDCESTLCDFNVTEKDVFNQLKQLNCSKANGPDAIPSRILKVCAEPLTQTLTDMFNLSLRLGKLPKDWTAANIVPIFKKGDKTNPRNYRPVSLTSIICKMLERIINRKLVDYFNVNNIIVDNQHGFRERRSCETQLLCSIHDWSEALDKGCSVDIAFLDISRAFDSVPHGKLLQKLSSVGIKGQLWLWLKHFLTNRKQRVRISGAYSSWETVISGVPQGTILGPTLFLLYINDIAVDLKSCCKLYADDCILYQIIQDPSDSLCLQQDLNRLSTWSEKWGLKFNEDKCKMMHLSRQINPLLFEYRMNGKLLEITTNEKYLGITVNNKFSWSTHINTITADANRKLGIINRVFGKCSRDIKQRLYQQLVLPKLEYCCIVWDPHLLGLQRSLEKVQKRALRVISGTWDIDYKKSLKDLSLLSLHDHRLLLKLVYCYKVMHNHVDIPFDQYFSYRNNRSLRQTHPMQLNCKFARTDLCKHSFFYSTPVEWNKLPFDICNMSSVKCFKDSLHSYFIKNDHKYCDICNVV